MADRYFRYNPQSFTIQMPTEKFEAPKRDNKRAPENDFSRAVVSAKQYAAKYKDESWFQGIRIQLVEGRPMVVVVVDPKLGSMTGIPNNIPGLILSMRAR